VAQQVPDGLEGRSPAQKVHGMGVPEAMGTGMWDIQTAQANTKPENMGNRGAFQWTVGCADTKKKLAVGELRAPLFQVLDQHGSSGIC